MYAKLALRNARRRRTDFIRGIRSQTDKLDFLFQALGFSGWETGVIQLDKNAFIFFVETMIMGAITLSFFEYYSESDCLKLLGYIVVQSLGLEGNHICLYFRYNTFYFIVFGAILL